MTHNGVGAVADQRFRPAVRWLAARPFLSALVVLGLVAIPGYARVNAIANDGRDTAEQVAELLERFEARTLAEEAERCQDRNSAQRAMRRTFTAMFDRFIELGAQPAAVDALREAVAPASEIDGDCDGDGTLGPEDYAG